ncbi:WXG100 family type VII secretion target [Dietzia sp. PP-33]|jgi:WXG100 family type VII secretion target|uniref:WXG100 family type VII secretion target n=1 Tax=Dietzia sp. PP-33 TaxID=2957500 RepID=UPI0029A493B2|nr:WXG100 family type VII secretion target [Dietzia sp. PP-33]MDX2358090.1 WXG100 family type VII secretion target [Dietzia sp. PP-33]
MAGFNTHLGTMDTAARRVDDVNTEIDRLLGNVRDSVSQLGGSVWRGAAQARFATIMSEWQQQSTKLNTALSGISETMRTNSTSFDAADQDSAQAISRVGAAGPLNI